MLSNRLYLSLLHSRHYVYFACSVLFTLAATTLGYQPYFEQTFSKLSCLGIMGMSVLFGLAYTAMIKFLNPHKI